MTLADENREILEPLIGSRLVSYQQKESLDAWQDDEPLYLKFEDGSYLEINVGGWHDSGTLYLERIPPEPPPCHHQHRSDSAVQRCARLRTRRWMQSRPA